jgi:hypothetical protein
VAAGIPFLLIYLLRLCCTFRWLAGSWVMLVGRPTPRSTAGYGDWQLHLPTNQSRPADDGDRCTWWPKMRLHFFDKS